ncbi:MAG: ATP-grasp domain-containing protein [Cyanobacteriota bacterium]
MNYKIWLGHSFSTAYHFIDLIRNNNENYKFTFFVTNNSENSIIFKNADFYEIEPIFVNDDDYLEYCLDFCEKNKIDIFIPNYKKLLIISKNNKKFKNTKVLIINDYNLFNTLDDKINLYESFIKNNIMEVPEHYIFNTLDEFKNYYNILKENDHKICIKPRYSESGKGFRVISDSANEFDSLLGFPSYFLSYNDLVHIFSQKDSFDDIIISEFLDGDEYSIDCLSDGKILYASVPRKKISKRVRFLEENLELIEIVKKIHDTYKVPYVYNVQMKYKNGIPKIIEINPRMSGGLNISCLSGVNFPFLAIKLLLNQEIFIPEIQYNIKTTYIEKEFLI